MSCGVIMMLLTIGLPIITGLAIIVIQPAKRMVYCMLTAVNVLTLLLAVGILICGADYYILFEIAGTLRFSLQADPLGKLFGCLVSVIFLFVSIFAFGYMEHEERQIPFFAFFIAALGALMGVAYAANLPALFLCCLLLNLFCFPLIRHPMSPVAKAAAKKYLIYMLIGSAMALGGILGMTEFGMKGKFVPGGCLDYALTVQHPDILLAAACVALMGFSCMAGAFPMHSWLTAAHPIAPSPASSLLSGFVTKAGVMAVTRMLYYVIGPQWMIDSWLQLVMIFIALLTILMGSMMAFREPHFKRRLAYSSISQVSYILFGLFVMNGDALTGALLQMCFHLIAKNTLIFSAGAIIETTGIHQVCEMRGLGRTMPLVMGCFAVASVALVGIPPTGGFVSKWYLASGSLQYKEGLMGILGVAVLMISALLTAGYLFSIVSAAFFPGEDCEPTQPVRGLSFMKWPMIALAAGCVLLGIFAHPLVEYFQKIAVQMF